MKRREKRLVGVLVSLVTTACTVFGVHATQQFTVTGELKPDGINIQEGTVAKPTRLSKNVDFSNARVVVAHEILNPAGETETIELASGHFQDGKVTLEGEIDESIDAEVVVYPSADERLTLDVLIYPGATVSFALVENIAQLELLGTSRKVRDPTNKFTISGDLSSLDGDLDGAIVQVKSHEYFSTGEYNMLNLGRVMLDKGEFIIEAEVGEPRVVNIVIIGRLGYTQTPAVLEPGAEITLSSQSSWIKGVFAISSEANRHVRFVDSWQQSEEYLSIRKEYLEAYQKFQSKPESVVDIESPVHRDLVRKLNRIRYDSLRQIARSAKDPIDILLVMELNAFWGKEEALPFYDSLAKSLDGDLVARRVTHARNNHAIHLATIGTDESLGIGEEVPMFTLPDLSEDKYFLEDLLDKNEVVLVDFWASWCGGCLATFPALKDLYTSYAEEGFEVVSISIDDNYDPWAERSEEQELPWVNLGELKGFEGDIARAYGVSFIPKSYLIDSQGQIIHKDLSTDQLKTFLVRKYGEP